MSAEALEHFRTLLTDSFTVVAVDVFNQVQTLVRSYEEENLRLRTLLNSVLQPEVRLPRLEVVKPEVAEPEVVKPEVAKPEVAEPEVAKPEVSEPEVAEPDALSRGDPSASCDQVKEEAMECDIGDGFNDDIKTEPELLACDTPSVAEVDRSGASSLTASAPASAYSDDDDDEGEDEDATQCQTEDGEASGKMTPPQKTLLETPRFKKPDSSFLPTPGEYREFISRLTDAYRDTPEEQRPLITRLGLDRNIEFVDCALGRVPKGSPLSYQHPLPSERDFTPLVDAPPQPRLPLQSQKIVPFLSPVALTAVEQVALNGMKVTWEAAYSLEQATRNKRELIDGLRDVRLMDCFRDIFNLKPGRPNAEALVAKIRRGKRRTKVSTMEQELRVEALRQYCRLVCLNWYPCGLVVHPGAPWLAAFPDGLVYDPNESVGFGLMHLRCESQRSFVECKYLLSARGTLQVKSKHPLYWQVQGEMMVTGTSWSDLLVLCADDMLVQRVYRDEPVIAALKNKTDQFFFFHFLPSLFREPPAQRDSGESEGLSQSEARI